MTLGGGAANLYDVADLVPGEPIPAGSSNSASPNNVEVKDSWNEFGFEDVCGTRLTDITTSGRISQTLQGNGCRFDAREDFTVASAAFVGCTLTSNGDSTFPTSTSPPPSARVTAW
jgi:hypothetical protein